MNGQSQNTESSDELTKLDEDDFRSLLEVAYNDRQCKARNTEELLQAEVSLKTQTLYKSLQEQALVAQKVEERSSKEDTYRAIQSSGYRQIDVDNSLELPLFSSGCEVISAANYFSKDRSVRSTAVTIEPEDNHGKTGRVKSANVVLPDALADLDADNSLIPQKPEATILYSTATTATFSPDTVSIATTPLMSRMTSAQANRESSPLDLSRQSGPVLPSGNAVLSCLTDGDAYKSQSDCYEMQPLAKTTQRGRNGDLELGEAIPPSGVDADSLQRKLISSGVPVRMFDVVSPHSLFVRSSPGYTVYGRHSPPMVVRPESESESTSSRRRKKARKRTEDKGKKQTTDEIPGFRGYQSVESLLEYIEGSNQNNEKLTTTDHSLYSSFKKVKKAKQELESSSKRLLNSPKHGDYDFDHGQFDSSLDDNVEKFRFDEEGTSNAVSPVDASAPASVNTRGLNAPALLAEFSDNGLSNNLASGLTTSSPLSLDTSPKIASSMQSSLYIDTSASADSQTEDFIPVTGRKAKYKRESASARHSDQSRPSNGSDNGRFQRRQNQQRSATPPAAARDRRRHDVSFDEAFSRTACNVSFRRRNSASPVSHAVASGGLPSPPSLVFFNQNSADRDASFAASNQRAQGDHSNGSANSAVDFVNDANNNCSCQYNSKIDKTASNAGNSQLGDCKPSYAAVLHHSQRRRGPSPTSQPRDGARLPSAVSPEAESVSSTNTAVNEAPSRHSQFYSIRRNPGRNATSLHTSRSTSPSPSSDAHLTSVSTINAAVASSPDVGGFAASASSFYDNLKNPASNKVNVVEKTDALRVSMSSTTMQPVPPQPSPDSNSKTYADIASSSAATSSAVVEKRPTAVVKPMTNTHATVEPYAAGGIRTSGEAAAAVEIISSSAQIKTTSSASVRSSQTNTVSSASVLPCASAACDRSAAANAVMKPSTDEALGDSVLLGTRVPQQQSPRLFGADVANRLESSHPKEHQFKPSIRANAEAATPLASVAASRRHKQALPGDGRQTQAQPQQTSSARVNREVGPSSGKAVEFFFEPTSSDASVVEGLSFGFHDVSDDSANDRICQSPAKALHEKSSPISSESVSSRKVPAARLKPNFDASVTIEEGDRRRRPINAPCADPMLNSIVSFVNKGIGLIINNLMSFSEFCVKRENALIIRSAVLLIVLLLHFRGRAGPVRFPPDRFSGPGQDPMVKHRHFHKFAV